MYSKSKRSQSTRFRYYSYSDLGNGYFKEKNRKQLELNYCVCSFENVFILTKQNSLV